MSFDAETATKLLQIIVITGAALGVIIGFIKFLVKRVDEHIDDKNQDALKNICGDVDKLKNDVTVLEKMMKFFEKYIIKAKQKYGDTNEDES